MTWHMDVDDTAAEVRDEQPTCPMCAGQGVHLGRLGKLDHFRCRNCAWNFQEAA